MHSFRRASRHMAVGLPALAGLLFLFPPFAALAQSVTVTVPGTSNLWLAGMPDGTREPGVPRFDSAPAQSPVEVVGLSLSPGGVLTFRARGSVTNDKALLPPDGPDGGFFGFAHNEGAANGISPLSVRFNALIGVFLGPDRPDLTPAPADVLDFNSDAQRNYASISPLLKQPFFIGDGLGAANRQQTILVPAGATRLFLGTADSRDWYNNGGAFTVTASVVPEPASALALAAAAALCLTRRCRR